MPTSAFWLSAYCLLFSRQRQSYTAHEMPLPERQRDGDGDDGDNGDDDDEDLAEFAQLNLVTSIPPDVTVSFHGLQGVADATTAAIGNHAQVTSQGLTVGVINGDVSVSVPGSFTVSNGDIGVVSGNLSSTIGVPPGVSATVTEGPDGISISFSDNSGA